jgi:aspartyl-tRNA synthetase
VVATAIEVLNKAEPLPFHATRTRARTSRLKYRYLDLRRPEMQRMMRTRIKLVQALRRWLDARGFQDIETPILTKATPEGARDFLVPARMHPGEFYALPQSPQLFKQILMVAGFDRYYQIARCFRDEALRADRQPEFTQLDMEFAWVGERDVQDFVEAMIREVLREVMASSWPNPFPRMTYAEAMRRYGSDKPDLRIDLELVDIAELPCAAASSRCSPTGPTTDGRVVALRARRRAVAQADRRLRAPAAKYGAKGLAWMQVEDHRQGPRGHQLADRQVPQRRRHARRDAHAAGAQAGDLLFFGAGTYKTVSDFMGAVRLKLGRDLGLRQNAWKPLWVTDFPMFEWDEEAQRYVALHHPFTAPAVDDIADLRANARTAVSRGYDMVLNGNEIGGGSIRIHRPTCRAAVFELLGIGAEEAQAKFGFLLEALATARRRTAASPSASTASPR